MDPKQLFKWDDIVEFDGVSGVVISWRNSAHPKVCVSEAMLKQARSSMSEKCLGQVAIENIATKVTEFNSCL